MPLADLLNADGMLNLSGGLRRAGPGGLAHGV